MKFPSQWTLSVLTAILATGAALARADERPGGVDPRWSETPVFSSGPAWSVDYEVRSMFDSCTSYQFGNPPDDPAGSFAPLSRLDFALDSTWHGLQIGLEQPNWRAHFEWLTPIRKRIDGVMADFDWNIDDPQNDPTRLDSLTHSSQRWNDGQLLELGADFLLTDRLFGLPIELWPSAGFRFQRLNITAYSLSSLVPETGPIPELEGVDIITFNQQYYVGYFGGQLRTTQFAGQMPIELTFQGDAGPTAGYNVDYHLIREGDRFTMEQTYGAAWHVALIVEAFLTRCLSVGLQADHTEIHTTGTHRLLNEPLDVDFAWDNGVMARSYQTSLTAFLRARF